MDFESLKESRLFNALSRRDFERIRAALSPDVQRFKKNNFLYYQGDRLTNIGILLEGSLLSLKFHVDGRAHILRTFSPSSAIGLETVVSVRKISPTSISANTDGLIAWLPYGKLLCDEDIPAAIRRKIYDNILGIIADDCIKLMFKSDILSMRTVRDRVLAYLSIVGERRGSDRIDIGMNQEEFARYLCVDRSSLSQELNKLRREGILDFSGKVFTLKLPWVRKSPY
ncbi:MAG: Crp/Fnr family transcriptional regulator [Clostridiales Family XIII bacterium]|jgi:CRP-like cAMP-binding protein|nr:Crp/Fnr family transcriptional regulator [Clostridiales Family XIII bacterium]